MEDVEGLGGAAPPALRVGAEQVVVRAPVPLQRGEGGKGGSQKTPADFKTDPHAPANVSRDQQRPPRYWLKQKLPPEKKDSLNGMGADEWTCHNNTIHELSIRPDGLPSTKT